MFLPFEALLGFSLARPDRCKATTRENINQFIESEFYRHRRFPGSDLLYPGRADALLSKELNKRGFALPFFPPLQFDGPQIRDEVTCMNGNSFGFHPSIIGKLLAPHRDNGF